MMVPGNRERIFIFTLSTKVTVGRKRKLKRTDGIGYQQSTHPLSFFTALILITTVTITRGKGNKTEIARRIHGPLIYTLTILSNQLLLLMNWQTGTDGENWSSREDLCKAGLVYSKPLPYTPPNDGESKEPAKEENVMNKSRIFHFLRNYTTFFAFHPSHTHRLRVRSGEVSTPHVHDSGQS